jgi:hypothetical protein
MNTVLTVIVSLLGVAVLKLVGGALHREMKGRVNRIPVMLLRLAARRLPVTIRQEWTEEWSGELAAIGEEYKDMPVTRLLKRAGFVLGVLYGAGGVGRAEVEEGDLIAKVEHGLDQAAEQLADKFIALADPAHQMRWSYSMGGLLTVAVDRLGMPHATELAERMTSAGRPDVALWWIQRWLRPERTCRRRPGDAVAMFRSLRESWQCDPAELRDAFLRGTDHWSWDSRQAVERMLDDNPPDGNP